MSIEATDARTTAYKSRDTLLRLFRGKEGVPVPEAVPRAYCDCGAMYMTAVAYLDAARIALSTGDLRLARVYSDLGNLWAANGDICMSLQ
jgi:hypothetical protein